jgi:hypothetical protein
MTTSVRSSISNILNTPLTKHGIASLLSGVALLVMRHKKNIALLFFAMVICNPSHDSIVDHFYRDFQHAKDYRDVCISSGETGNVGCYYKAEKMMNDKVKMKQLIESHTKRLNLGVMSFALCSSPYDESFASIAKKVIITDNDYSDYSSRYRSDHPDDFRVILYETARNVTTGSKQSDDRVIIGVLGMTFSF